MIVSALATGIPILFVGGHGAAKTDGAEVIARAILGERLKWAVYECPNLQVDDLIGFPDIQSLKDGNVGFVGLPMSVWNVNAVVLDELTRASPSTAAKLLELVRKRRVYGLDTAIEYVFATANPPSKEHAEVHKLGLALVSRFAVVHVPSFAELDDEDATAVLTTKLGGSWSWWPLSYAEADVATVLGIRAVCAKHKVHVSGRQARHLRALLGAAVAAADVGCVYTPATLTTLVLACIPEASGLCTVTCDVPKLVAAITTFFEERAATQLPRTGDWPQFLAAVTARARACATPEQAAALHALIPEIARVRNEHEDDVRGLMAAITPLLFRYSTNAIANLPVQPLSTLLPRVLS